VSGRREHGGGILEVSERGDSDIVGFTEGKNHLFGMRARGKQVRRPETVARHNLNDFHPGSLKLSSYEFHEAVIAEGGVGKSGILRSRKKGERERQSVRISLRTILLLTGFKGARNVKIRTLLGKAFPFLFPTRKEQLTEESVIEALNITMDAPHW